MREANHEAHNFPVDAIHNREDAGLMLSMAPDTRMPCDLTSKIHL